MRRISKKDRIRRSTLKDLAATLSWQSYQKRTKTIGDSASRIEEPRAGKYPTDRILARLL